MADKTKRVFTTFDPETSHDVDEAEYLDLERQGLLVEGAPVVEINDELDPSTDLGDGELIEGDEIPAPAEVASSDPMPDPEPEVVDVKKKGASK